MEDLSLSILDIAENSANAGASEIRISVTEDKNKDLVELVIEDNGKGMDEATSQRASDPFFTTRTTRRVGLGLAFLKQAAQEAHGEMKVESARGKGTKVTARFQASHIDRRPLGALGGTIKTLACGYPDIEFICLYRKDGVEKRFETMPWRDQLPGGRFGSPEGLRILKQLESWMG
jgi:anti-sigma regulatory factor (Ser/Thr protein kinase)